jgi:hypothetical protein
LKFFRWVTIFVAHFLAKRTLEYQSARIFQVSPNTFKKPKIKIFAVNSEEYTVPSWKDFKRVIQEASADKDKVDDFITALEEGIREGSMLKGDAPRHLATIKRILEGNMPTIRLRMHCEAVFAALLEIRQRVQSQSKSPADTDFKELAKFFEVLGLVCLDVECFIHTFPDLAARYDFSFQIVLPRLLGTFQSS